MKIMKFWPFEVAEESERRLPPLEVLFLRVVIVGLASGVVSALIVVVTLHYL
jgi:hypothetical protein